MNLLAGVGLLVALWGLGPADQMGRFRATLGRGALRGGAPPDWLLTGGSAAFAGVLLLLVAPRMLLVVVPGSVAALTAGWLAQQARASRRRQASAAEVVQACQAVAVQLRVGEIPAKALARVATDSPLLRPVAATQVIGGDVPAALHELARRPGCHGLAALARSWQLCLLTGAPVAAAASRVAEALRADAATQRMVDAELAAARATGRMLALLPGMGVGLGYVSGGDPLHFLLTSVLGQACLAGAVCLVCAGLIWTNRLAVIGQDVAG